ncbi:terminase large subunit [Dyadobacter sp. CY261]|uniref:terminase large subunit n=1 Tax=Dyadobacter sp. CY261 TaxID=2907203 RepID=UPI001F3A16C4|nr:terminase TerL endonuclease subunit [Dyadobacter sp. CY261]MCF0074471.1 terminase large subunit [Dyadobacter sp. CY261]
MNKLETALQYAEDVRDGKILVNKYIKLAIERHFRDLENAEVKGWYFSDKSAQKALMFFDFLVLTKGVTKANVPKEQINPDGSIRFQLAPWQAFMIASIFGWKKIVNNKRRFTEAYIEIPKKNGKSTIASGIANLMLIADREAGPEVYFGAYTRDQAGICFDEAVAQIKDSRALKSRVTILKNTVTVASTRAKMMAVSHDADNTEGKNGHCTIIDEYHVHKSDKVKDSLSTGQSAREQPLQFVITTAGYNLQGPCYRHRGICIDMLENKHDLDHLFCLIYGIDEDDDWRDERNWVKANPTIGVTTKIEKLREEFAMALRSGSKEVDFKTKRLNLWVAAESTWIPNDTWMKGADPKFVPPRGSVCYGGIDLGRTNDVSSFALYFPAFNYLVVKHYVASEAAEYAERGGISYNDWIRDGHLISTKGKTTDYEFILDDIFEAADEWTINFIGFDPAGAQLFRDRLSDAMGTIYAPEKGDDGKIKWNHHDKVQAFKQGHQSFGPPTALLEELAIKEAIKHDGNPVTAWMLGNVVVVADHAGNIRPTKSKSKDKIDGIVASIMALGMMAKWHHMLTSKKKIAVW